MTITIRDDTGWLMSRACQQSNDVEGALAVVFNEGDDDGGDDGDDADE